MPSEKSKRSSKDRNNDELNGMCHTFIASPAVAISYPEAAVKATYKSPGPLLLSAFEAAQILGIGSRTLWSMTKAGEIPRVTIGPKQYRYHVRDLEAWIARNKTSTPIPDRES
jgi:excisionase family DNA binding protein